MAVTPALSSVLVETAAPRRKRQRRELGRAATALLLVRGSGSLRLSRAVIVVGHRRPVAGSRSGRLLLGEGDRPAAAVRTSGFVDVLCQPPERDSGCRLAVKRVALGTLRSAL